MKSKKNLIDKNKKVMPKPQYGELQQGIEVGDHPMIIQQVIDLGHQYDKKNVARHRYYINLYSPEYKMYKAVSNFGVPSWLSKNKYPYVGLYEIISAVLGKNDATEEELKTYNVFDLINKPVTVTIEEVNGYNNITSIHPCIVPIEIDNQNEIKSIALDINEAMNPATLVELDPKVAKLIRESKEYNEPKDVDKSLDPFASINASEELSKVQF